MSTPSSTERSPARPAEPSASRHAPPPARTGGDRWQLPRLDRDDRIVGGLAAGVAREIGVDPIWVRLAFVVLFAVGGWGALLYAVGWGATAAVEHSSSPPRTEPVAKGATPRDRQLGLWLIVIGLVIVADRLTIVPARHLWPCAVVAAGVVLARRPLRAGAPTRWGPLQVVAGLVMAVSGVGLFVVNVIGRGTALEATVGVGAALVLVVAAAAPWWWGLVRSLDAERQARARSEERAEVAAHLHDSVLQTLVLIQKSDDPTAMAQLARRQERELRNWLDPDRVSRHGGSLRGVIDDLASGCEADWGVRVEVVVVGDCTLDDTVAAAVAAAREAVVNAAKHAGVDRVDLYAEVSEDQLELFVRDAGPGFDLEQVDGDRRGLRHSIVGRVERVGGSAAIHTAPGEGTEIEIHVPRVDELSHDRLSHDREGEQP
ncbi:MAG: ATP-binding protein [Acidimicrobiales bacterium]